MIYEVQRGKLERYLVKSGFNDDWKDWITTNIEAGCDRNGMFRIMLDAGFDYDLIRDALDFEPMLPVDQITNPLEQSKQNSPLFIPNGKRLAQDGIEFYLLEDFLNPEECDQIITRIRSRMRPSDITAKDEPDKYYRTSSTCDLGLLDDPVVAEIDRRICAVTGLDPAWSESIQGQHYDIGQEFKAHTDYFEKEELSEYGGALGQRSYTVMIYLNDVEDGGETSFPRLGQTVLPRQGRAVIWNSLHPDGSLNHNSMHHAHPVKKGSKTVITKWFRTKDGLPAYSRQANENIPNHTRIGFKKDVLPKTLYRKIGTFYRRNLKAQVDETVPGDFIKNTGTGPVASSLVELSQSLRDEIHDCLKGRLEKWSALRLDPTFVYGIRIYHRGTVLESHRDRLETHIISAIINIDQQVNEDWPLMIEDNYYRRHEIFLHPGEMVFYEGGRLLHGRPTPLDGDCYANIFCHFKPAEKL